MNTNFGFSFNQFNIGKELLLSIDNNILLDSANRILNDELLVLNLIGKSVLHGNMKYNVQCFDWDVKASASPNSFQMNLQALGMIVILSAAYFLNKENNKSKEYINRGLELLKSWDNYRKDTIKSSNNPFVWNDHATALRAENIILFAFALEAAGLLENNKDLRKFIENILFEHALKLLDDSFYFPNHNHGIFQDRSLIYLAYFLKNKSWFEVAKKRLINQKKFAFNDEMIHVENSPGYQAIVMELFLQIANFLIEMGEEFGHQLAYDIHRAADIMCFMLKPNGKMAEVGDTDGGLGRYMRVKTDKYLFRSSHLNYVVTQGENGEAPKLNKGIFKKSGYYFYREHWNKSDFKNSTWLMFKAGYTSQSHKHNDDLSFMLYTKGHDVFVDCGWYNYVWGNKYRQYLVSANAHNTIVVDGKGYSTTNENSYKVGMLIAQQNKDYDYLLGFNDSYHGVYIDRHFYSMKNMFLIFDNIKSGSRHNYRQLFHLSQSVSIANFTKNEVLIRIADTGYFVRIKQLLGVPKLKIQTGDFRESKYGYISRGFNHIDSTTSIIFELDGYDCDFVTLITIENADGIIDGVSDISFDINTKSFKFTRKNSINEIVLRERQRFDISKVVIEPLGGNKFRVINQSQCPQDTQYAWYLIESDTNKIIKKTQYLNENSYIFEIPPSKDGNVYWIRAYMRNSLYQRKTQIVASFVYDSKSNSYHVNSSQKYGLYVSGQSVIKIGENKYKFVINYNYFGEIQIQWLIYKNSGAKESIYTRNQSELDYEFTEPGDYDVMCYLKTIGGGDKEFYIFPTITIR